MNKGACILRFVNCVYVSEWRSEAVLAGVGSGLTAVRLAAARSSTDGGQGMHLPHCRLYNPALYFNTRYAPTYQGAKWYEGFVRIIHKCGNLYIIARDVNTPWHLTSAVELGLSTCGDKERCTLALPSLLDKGCMSMASAAPPPAVAIVLSIQAPLRACAVWLPNRVGPMTAGRSP